MARGTWFLGGHAKSRHLRRLPARQGPKPLFVKEVSVFGVQKLCAKTKGLFKLNCLPRQGYIRRTKSRHIFQTQLLTDESISVGSYETRSVSAGLK